MRFTKEVLRKTTIGAVGEDAIPVVEYLKGKKDISEFKIAQDLKVDIHLIRNSGRQIKPYQLNKCWNLC